SALLYHVTAATESSPLSSTTLFRSQGQTTAAAEFGQRRGQFGRQRNLPVPELALLEGVGAHQRRRGQPGQAPRPGGADRRAVTRHQKSTRLNSSHVKISYAVFCLKK